VDLRDTIRRIDGTEVALTTPWLGKVEKPAKAARPKAAAKAEGMAAEAKPKAAPKAKATAKKKPATQD
jgi:NADH-quinone oxidoreductase subunit E